MNAITPATALDVLTATQATLDADSQAAFHRGLELVQEYRVLQMAPYLDTPDWIDVAARRIKQHAAEDARAAAERRGLAHARLYDLRAVKNRFDDLLAVFAREKL